MRSPEPQPNDNTRDLVSRLSERDESAWRDFVDRFAPPMYTFFIREFEFDHGCAEDLTSDSLRRIMKSISRFKYRSDGEFKAWVFAIARNVAIDHLRRRRHEVPLPAHLQDIAYSLLNPETEACVASAVNEAMMQLAAPSRKVLELRFFQGKDAQEIAGQIGSTYGAVRVSLHRALKQLESILRSDGRILRRLRK
jgi:RNA polymerase sigma-70 factor (ECF subfamily)